MFLVYFAEVHAPNEQFQVISVRKQDWLEVLNIQSFKTSIFDKFSKNMKYMFQ